MICCSDPNCAEEAGLTLQRSIDPAAVAFCLPHGYQREAELKQQLQNYQLVSIVAMPPSELELAQARLAELEERAGAGVVFDPDTEVGAQLETALQTLELQSKTLEKARAELADRDTALQSLRRELERTRTELTTVRAAGQKATDDLELVKAELERTRGELAGGEQIGRPETPVPPTRPDRK